MERSELKRNYKEREGVACATPFFSLQLRKVAGGSRQGVNDRVVFKGTGKFN